jgi:hypothetical protein
MSGSGNVSFARGELLNRDSGHSRMTLHSGLRTKCPSSERLCSPLAHVSAAGKRQAPPFSRAARFFARSDRPCGHHRAATTIAQPEE